MKKNKMMRTASGLLVATLLTTSVISGTFAKYTTTASGSDSARVAKFGVTIEANGGMFATEYAKDDKRASITSANSVISSKTNEKVVAPGTKGDLVNATIKGTPEVAVHVAYEPTLTLDGWKVENGEVYCPIVFKVNDKTYGLNGIKDAAGKTVDNQSTTITELKTAVENAIKAYSKDYEPNTNLSKKNADYVNVSWEWAFDKNEDVKDTYLGDCAADDKTDNDSKVELSIKTTVTQID